MRHAKFGISKVSIETSTFQCFFTLQRVFIIILYKHRLGVENKIPSIIEERWNSQAIEVFVESDPGTQEALKSTLSPPLISQYWHNQRDTLPPKDRSVTTHKWERFMLHLNIPLLHSYTVWVNKFTIFKNIRTYT